jgi:hypothetical protein
VSYSFVVQADTGTDVLAKAKASIQADLTTSALKGLKTQIAMLRQPSANEVVFARMEGSISTNVKGEATVITMNCQVGIQGRVPAPA